MKHSTYPKYKPSGVEWLGDVPEHWGVKKLKFIGTSLIGLTYSPDEVVDEDYEGKKHLVLRSTNIQDGKISLHENVYVTTPVSKELEVRKWDILICARNGSRHLVGKNALVNETDENITFGAFTTVFRSKINPFLFYYFSSSQFQYQSTGFLTTTINQLTNGNLNSIITTLPPLPEQQAIANFLDRETRRIDLLIRKKKKFVELLKEKRTALISRAVTKGLNPKIKMKPSGVEWLGDVPAHWEIWKIAHGFDLIGSGTTPPSDELEWYDGTIAWITTSELRESIINSTEKSVSIEAVHKFSALKIFPKNSLAIAMYGATIGRLGILGIEATTNQACCVMHGGKIFFIPFVYFWMQAFKESIILLASGGGQPNISQDKIKSIKIPCPSVPEQQAIAAFLDHETSKIDTLTAKVESAIEKLKEYRTAMISAAVTGKIDVSTGLNTRVREVA